ncbi:dihydrolipoamide acetyltransferase family protein [Quadrisphaera sp. DSM 44207]|uniref:dihydrolipoamide acetyltransferase family protein n=1 Tax=Quadrisphaera sp. DSM 44207 TaxID=1881057 RepID=UPI000885E7DD|nr:dihydrolipoamide acetyltransferase family protein [Quadrisphaera sp. DSM 44207]SDQ88828.1 pyruvate dehydrogenase E2 component (dihydrolipoamide acetyltransferase) [Quadrisphaera sp. DSM 44207]
MAQTQQFALPDVGEGLTEAEVVRWLVQVGDAVEVNAPVVEVETAKSVVELPSPWAGVVQELLVSEGRTVDVGTPLIAVSVPEEGDLPTTDEAAAAQAQAAPSAEPAEVAPSAQAGLEASPEQAEGARSSVLVGYGPRTGGPLRRRRGAAAAAAAARQAAAPPPAAPAPAGAPASASAPAPEPAAAAPSPAPSPGSSPAPEAPESAPPQATGVAAGISRVLAKPPVRALARTLGVDLGSVRGTGTGGTVTREDLLEHAPDAQTVREGRETRVPVRGVRKATAQQMVASAFTAPQATAFVTVDVTRTMKLLDRLREDREFAGVHLSPLLVLARAICLAVGRNPGINASWDEDAQEIVLKHYVNLGIAVATRRGLLVPNVKDAGDLALLDLATALTQLVRTARDGRSTPADLTGGTISITNIGVFGVDTGTPILNPGEAAIVCVGAVRQRPWVHKGRVRPRWVAELSVSFDHRLVDGDLGSRFLADVAAVLERPDRALLWA